MNTDINTQARILLAFLGVFSLGNTLLHLLFPAWNMFRNKYARDILGEKDALLYEKKSSFLTGILGLFLILAVIIYPYAGEKSMGLLLLAGIFLSLLYQARVNRRYFGTFGRPFHPQRKRFRWLRILIYTVILFLLYQFLLPYEKMNLYIRFLIIMLAAEAGSRFVDG